MKYSKKNTSGFSGKPGDFRKQSNLTSEEIIEQRRMEAAKQASLARRKARQQAAAHQEKSTQNNKQNRKADSNATSHQGNEKPSRRLQESKNIYITKKSRKKNQRLTKRETNQHEPSHLKRYEKTQSQKKQVDLSTSKKSSRISVEKPKKKRRKPFWLRFLLFLIIVIAIVSVVAFIYLRFYNLHKDLSDDEVLEKYHISEDAAEFAKDHRVVNLAIIGIDGREDVESARGDVMMIATADYEHGGIKIATLMRDTLVYYEPEYTYYGDEAIFAKLNAAFSWGYTAAGGNDVSDENSYNTEAIKAGAERQLAVINENFDLAITDYIVVDFNCVAEMVDAVDGVDVEIKSEAELNEVNLYIGDVNAKLGTDADELEEIGTQHLNGPQALAYARIRYVGNGDYERTERQRTVFKQVVTKAMDLSPLGMINLVKKVLPYCDTSLTNMEMIAYGFNVLLMKNRSLSEFAIPDEDYLVEGSYYSESVLYSDTLCDNVQALYAFIFEENYYPSEVTENISNEIESILYGYW